MELQAEAGAAERSRVWTPDVELYNHARPIWGGAAGALGPRLAAVYACDGTPAGRAGCGAVWFSARAIRGRSGALRVLLYKSIVFGTSV